MLKPWERPAASIGFEVDQRRQEGCEIDAALTERIRTAIAQDDEPALRQLLKELAALQPAAGFSFDEPEDLAAIRAARPDGPRKLQLPADLDLNDRIYDAWLGRAAGCALGKPVEKWPKDTIAAYLEHYGALPLSDYIPAGKGFPANHASHYTFSGMDCARGKITHMPRDDDMDYTIIGLAVLEQYGIDFTPVQVGLTWLDRLPYNLLYTAERIAYRNLINGIVPPASARTENPFREWIGAQIRADVWGYVTPGRPELAAELAFRDACISHSKNGIYGAMFLAALLAASYATSDGKKLIEIGLSEIPANCRLAVAIQHTLQWCDEYEHWQQTWHQINEHYGHYADVHTINNALLVVMGLMHGQGDFEQTIVTTVLGGWDADCTTASAGSLIGLVLGAKALPHKWVGVFNDKIKSAVRGEQHNRISALAQRTHAVAAMVLAND
ncbi:MAG: hypothetical protein GWP70_06460 [Proteobacteria bacterium]|nr:hypothetical protein [Pseudomonadota bacterium]